VLIKQNEEQDIHIRCEMLVCMWMYVKYGWIDMFNINKSICLKYDCVSFILYNKTCKSPQVNHLLKSAILNTQSKFQRELKAHKLNSYYQSLGNLSIPFGATSGTEITLQL